MIGAIVRLNCKGLGYQTRALVEHYGVDRVLAVFMRNRNFPDNPWLLEHYPDVHQMHVEQDRVMDQDIALRFLDGLDAVYSAETLYDWRFADWARAAGAITVVQGNPEFYTHHRVRTLQQPDRWIWPTTWMLDKVAPGHVVPCPVPDSRNFVAADPHDPEFKVVHVAGHAAAGDRNGTEDFMKAICKIRTDVTVTVIGQDGWLPSPGGVPRNVNLVLNKMGVPDPTELYRDQHLVVLPRRYGGNCLPANEACAAGCAIAMPIVSPNERWPILGMDTRPGKPHLTPYGPVQTISVRPEVIAATIDRANRNRERLASAQASSRMWAEANTWSALRPLYDKAFAP